MAEAGRALIWALLIMLITPILVIALGVGISVGAYNTLSSQVRDQTTQAQAEHRKTMVMQEQHDASEAARAAAAHALCEPIVTLYCARRSAQCNTKEIEYLCLTDDSITPQNYQQVIRNFHHKQNKARNDASRAARHYESGRDWFWL